MSIRGKDKGEIRETIESLEKQIDQCRILYELYFNGVEKREPLWHRQQIVRVFTQLRREKVSGAALRFKLQGLQARFNTFSQYWNRVNLQREQGTYHKDLAKARRRMAPSFDEPGAKEARALLEQASADDTAETPTVYSLEDLEKPDLGASERKPNRAAAAAAAATDRSSRVGNLPEERVQKIYRTYLKAKQRCGESTANLSYESVARSMSKQIPQLQQRGYSDIDFKVVIRGGKAALKPVAKKKG